MARNRSEARSQTAEWPTHGHAVNARNETAESLVVILDELKALQRRVEDGEVTRFELTLSINKMQHEAFSSLVLMVQQKAPIHPSRLMK